MPYISKENRRRLDPLIDDLVKELIKIAVQENIANEGKNPSAYAGLLNYIISRTVGSILNIHGLRYWRLALLTGVLENVKQELYRRIAEPYEDEQIKKNSDISEYEYLNECIRNLK